MIKQVRLAYFLTGCLFLNVLTLRAQPPINDDPCNAIVLTPTATCSLDSFTNAGATATAGVPAPGCASYNGGDVWFQAVVPASGGLIIQTRPGVMTDGGMAIYSGTCSSLTLLECDDDDGPGNMPQISRNGLLPGSTIWIRMWEYGNNQNGSFAICVTLPPPPPVNDNPCNAVELTVGGTCTFQTFSNVSATNSPGVPAPGCGTYAGKDVWFKAVVPASGALLINTNSGVGINDAAMAVYAGTCSSLRLLACDDDAGSGDMPQLRFDALLPGETVWIRVWDNSGDDVGSFGICASSIANTPVNNSVCQATNLPVNTTCTYQQFTTAGATATIGVPVPGCADYRTGDVWFKAVIPAEGAIRVQTRQGNGTLRDAGLALYTGNDCNRLFLLDCDDNSSPVPNSTNNFLMPMIEANGLLPGSTIWIRVFAAGTTSAGSFDICASIPEPQPASFSLNCTKDTVIGCGGGVSCFSLATSLPNIRASSATYEVSALSGSVAGASGCFKPYVNPGVPGRSADIITDDVYTDPIQLPFSFSFFESEYNALIASTNGFVSFDLSKANEFSHYGILKNGNLTDATTGTPQNLPSTIYDRALIMAPYHDLNPFYNTSANRRIKYNVVGVAPNRKWVLSYYKVPLFRCSTLINNTHQLVLHEGTGVVEIFVFDKDVCTEWNQGRAMIGMQNFDRNSAVMAPGRRATDAPWSGTNLNESWRFVPSSGASLFKKVELLDTLGNLIATGDTSGSSATRLNVRFNNICPAAGQNNLRYIVKTTFGAFNNAALNLTSTDTINVIRGGAALNASFIITNAKCRGDSGSIVINPSSGVPPFQYAVNSSTFQTTNSFRLPAGSYNLSIKDAGNCTKDTVIAITAPAAIATSYAVIHPKCFGAANGNITITAANGIAPYTYAIGSGNFQAADNFTLPAGTYLVRVKDDSNCVKDSSITLVDPSLLVVAVAGTGAKCNGAADGVISISASGGTGPYSFSADGGASYQTNSQFLKAAGTYAIRVKDANDCTKDTTVVVTQPLPLLAAATTVNATCSAAPNGQITITASGGTGPYNYGLSGAAPVGSNQFTVDQGSYALVIADANGCSTNVNATVGFTFNLTLNTRADTAICDEVPVLLTTSGNAQQYLWSPATGLNSNNIASPLASPTATTAYVVTATTGNCVLKDTIVVSVSPSPVVNAGADITLVRGDDGQLNGVVSNAVSFQWSPTTALIEANTLNPILLQPQQSVVYRLTATNSAGCSKFDDVSVVVLPYCIKTKNAFTPNGDGINDTWSVYDQFNCLSNVGVQVFNRYGSKVYENRNYRNEWRGTYNGKPLPDATYYYVIDYKLISGRVVQVRGDVTILR